MLCSLLPISAANRSSMFRLDQPVASVPSAPRDVMLDPDVTAANKFC